jgi:hypothetical protein
VFGGCGLHSTKPATGFGGEAVVIAIDGANLIEALERDDNRIGLARIGRGLGGGTANQTGITTAWNDGELAGVAVCDHRSDRLDIGGYGNGKRAAIGVEAALLA